MKIMDMMMKMEEGVFLKIQNWISRLFLILNIKKKFQTNFFEFCFDFGYFIVA